MVDKEGLGDTFPAYPADAADLDFKDVSFPYSFRGWGVGQDQKPPDIESADVLMIFDQGRV